MLAPVRAALGVRQERVGLSSTLVFCDRDGGPLSSRKCAIQVASACPASFASDPLYSAKVCQAIGCVQTVKIGFHLVGPVCMVALRGQHQRHVESL
jgi:hypothetical protein